MEQFLQNFQFSNDIRKDLMYDQNFYGGQKWWMGGGVTVKDT